MKSLKYVSAQPDELYFAWQVEVMLDNFLSHNIPGNDIHILVAIDKTPSQWWHKLIEKYPSVGFFFYKDERTDKTYSPSVRPHILAKHFERFPELCREAIFYHDCDILFTRDPRFESLLEGDTWYLSDNRSDYLSSKYISSKGEHILSNMCKIVQISRTIVQKNDIHCGGAQYVMKNLTPHFWRLVEGYSKALYAYLCSIDSDIQKWTADMWALLWVAWKNHQSTRISPLLDFAWATDTWPKWETYGIYHNAGAVEEHRGILFLKQDYRVSLPYNDETVYDPQFCSNKYHSAVMIAGKNTCLKPQEPNMNDLLNDCKSIFISV